MCNGIPVEVREQLAEVGSTSPMGPGGTDLRSQTQRQVPALARLAVLSTLRTMLLKRHLFSVLRIEPVALCARQLVYCYSLLPITLTLKYT